MNNSNAMAQQPPPQRPPYYHRPPNAHPNMSPPAYAQSPPLPVHYPPPNPYGHSPYPQPPAPKRPRLSPGPQSPYPSSNVPQMQSPQNGSPMNGISINGFAHGPPPPGSMGPPSRPADRPVEDRNFDDILAGTGINIEEEDRRLTSGDFYGHPTPNSSFQSPHGSFGSFSNGLRGGVSGLDGREASNSFNGTEQQDQPQLSDEEIQRRRNAQADWDAAKHSQHPLWDSFLYGETLQQKIRKHCYNEHVKAPEKGLLQHSKSAHPQATRVEGLDGASRVIDRGQTILQKPEGDALRDVLNTICLAAKERLTGFVDLSARLAHERLQHSKGKIPTEWAAIAAVANPAPARIEGVASPAASTPMKRSLSEANAGTTSSKEFVAAPHRIAAVFQRVSQAEREAETARLAKRARRNASAQPDAGQNAALPGGGPDTPGGTLQDGEKKMTKKDRKAVETKFTEQQQHKSANETARMATAGILGGKFGGKSKKQYSWLSGGSGAGSSSISTPVKTSTASASTSAAATPATERMPAVPKSKLFGQWDEDNDPGIQARDVLLVLETDGKAPRSYVRGYSKPEG